MNILKFLFVITLIVPSFSLFGSHKTGDGDLYNLLRYATHPSIQKVFSCKLLCEEIGSYLDIAIDMKEALDACYFQPISDFSLPLKKKSAYYYDYVKIRQQLEVAWLHQQLKTDSQSDVILDICYMYEHQYSWFDRVVKKHDVRHDVITVANLFSLNEDEIDGKLPHRYKKAHLTESYAGVFDELSCFQAKNALKLVHGYTVMHNIMMSNNFDLRLAQLLLDGGFDLTVQDEHGRTPLHAALIFNYCRSNAKFLLEHGLNNRVNRSLFIFDKEGRSPLHYAVESAKQQCTSKGELDGTFIHPIEPVMWLLQRGANIHVRDNKGVLPRIPSVLLLSWIVYLFCEESIIRDFFRFYEDPYQDSFDQLLDVSDCCVIS